MRDSNRPGVATLLAACIAAMVLLAGCPSNQAPPEPGKACAIAGDTATARDGQLLVCRNGRWERA